MTIKDEILEALRSRTSWAEVKAKFRSKSQRYEALREYFPEAEKILEEKLGQIAQAEEDLRVFKEDICELEEQKADLTGKSEALSAEVAEKSKALEELEERLTLLEAKGFSVEMLEKVAVLDMESGGPLLSQMVAFRDFKQLQKEVAIQRRKKTLLEKSLEELSVQEEEIEEQIRSEANRLDELKVHSTTYENAVSTVLSLFDAGYSPDDLQALSDGLKALGITGNSHLSVSRLVEGVRKVKTLHSLDQEICKKNQKLNALSRETSAAKGELQGLKQLVKDFEEVKKVAMSAIDETARQAKEKIDSSSERLENLTSERLSELESIIEASMGKVTAELSEWGDMNQKKGKLKMENFYGQVFLGMLGSAEYLREIPISVVVIVLERLLLWCEMHLQGVRVKPSSKITQKDSNLNQYMQYELPTLIEFILESLREYMYEGGGR